MMDDLARHSECYRALLGPITVMGRLSDETWDDMPRGIVSSVIVSN